MNILFVTDIPLEFTCGSSAFVKRTALLLQKNGHKVMLLCPGRRLRHECHDVDGVSVWGVPSVPAIVQKHLRLSPPFMISRTVRKAFDAFHPDIVHVQSHFFLPACALREARRRGVATVGTNHFMPENVMYHLRLPGFLSSMIIRAGWKHLHVIFRKLDAVTTPTETAANFLRRSGFPLPVQAISNGIDLQLFQPSTVDGSFCKKYALPEKKPVILYVGRLDPEKNVEQLIQAMPLVLKTVDAHLVIVGRGARGPSLALIASKLGVKHHVSFMGFVPDEDMHNVYARACCFAMPGTAELQSIATMEAMASGLPVVAANAMALPELVQEGDNGFLYNSGDIQVLAERLIALCTDQALRARMAAQSLTLIQRHTIQHTLSSFEALYLRVLKKGM